MFNIPCLFLVLVFWGPVQGGPMTNPHPNMTDQELFWGADQYDFSVVLPASGLECFWHFAHRGEKFYLNFMVRRKRWGLNIFTWTWIDFSIFKASENVISNIEYFSLALNVYHKIFSHFKSIRRAQKKQQYNKTLLGRNPNSSWRTFILHMTQLFFCFFKGFKRIYIVTNII